ncbi:MAG: hypothetical protein M3Y42_05900 [Actinomycetota bacterium]|nr:hypothetical protein [Actinomycetota bacterium]
MDPLLNKIEALAEPGCYSLTFALDDGAEQALVMRLRADEAIVPTANAFAGWTPGSPTFGATVAVVRAMHAARERSAPSQANLRDIDGGWDVGIGNVILSANYVPFCVAHGELQSGPPGIFRCPVCGAAAAYEG